MRPVQASLILDYLLYFFLLLFSWILKLKINAHQQISHWKSRLSQCSISRREQQRPVSLSEVNVGQSKYHHEESDRSGVGAAAPIKIEPHTGRNAVGYKSFTSELSQQSSGSNYIKTPRFRRSRLFSLLRRLSPRNFMDYCVIALNEASGSASSNKFDLSTYSSSIIWLLGNEYHMPDDSDKLLEDIRSKLWITYRKNFPPIDESTRYTTDRGFGCMIRCGQMVLANALLYKNFGRDWRWSPKGLDANPQVYSKILRLFQDREDCLYSIHRIVQTGLHEGKSVGEWFGPNTIAQALKRISSNYLAAKTIDNDILISIDAALDNMVVIDEIKSKFKNKSELKNGTTVDGDTESVDNTTAAVKDKTKDDEIWTPGILFIQLRLGLTKINPLYFAALRKTFQFENSLGIIGGRPNHALYLVGYTDDDIIYLDPHSTQQYIDFDEISRHNNEQQQVGEQTSIDEQSATYTSPDSTYHCSVPEKMPIERLDPSLALCFYFNTETDFDNWCNLSQDLLVKSEHAPMFEITNSRPSDWNVSLTVRTTSKSSSDHDEEFEILS